MTVTLAVSKHACMKQQKAYACFGPPHTNPFFLSQFLQIFDTQRNQNYLRVLSSIVVTSFTTTKPNIFIAQNLDSVHNDALQNVFKRLNLNNMFKTVKKVFIDMMASKSKFVIGV